MFRLKKDSQGGVLSSSNVNALKRANSDGGEFKCPKRAAPGGGGGALKYGVLIRKISNKKHKTWEDDGTMIVQPSGNAVVKDTDGLVVGHIKVNRETLKEEDILSVGLKEVMVDGLLEASCDSSNSIAPSVIEKQQHTASQIPKATSSNGLTFPGKKTEGGAIASPYFLSNRPLKGNSGTPKHDPEKPGAIVMSRPKTQNGQKIVDVVIDPILSEKLREHQIEGVKFLYECVMGLRGYHGALLADDMGLGKTLMTISLLWTLLKQSPYGKPCEIKKAIVVCPVTLIDNWKREFTRWLGSLRIRLLVVGAKTEVKDFINSSVYQVMIIGYDRLRLASEVLKKAKVDIIVCDEAQKLKNIDSKATKSILSLNAPKRIMLSGTPIQNNLSEFYAMADFLNPGVLGKQSDFKKDYETPIQRGQDPQSTQKNREKGEERLNELIQKTKGFVLRRTADTIKAFLPPKTETILFCLPWQVQRETYRKLLESSEVKESFMSLGKGEVLSAITKLKKACNSPLLLNPRQKSNSSMLSGKLAVLKLMLAKLRDETDEKVVIVSSSTKVLDLVDMMLSHLRLTSLRLDGTTKPADRQKYVDQFNRTGASEKFAFLLSAKSGGTGLNLIGASRLFLIDGEWNPTIDEQAMARIHRDGQKRPVYIYRLLITGSIDEKIYQRQITKKGLASRFMEDNNNSSSTAQTAERTLSSGDSNSFTTEELRDLFRFYENTVSNTHDLLACACRQDGAESVLRQNPSNSSQNVPEVEEEGLGGFMNAKTVAEQGPFVPKRLRASERLKRLLEYRHINPTLLLDDDDRLSNIGDVILQQVLKEASSTNDDDSELISFLFTKSNDEIQ